MALRPLGPGPGAYGLPTTVGYSGHDPSRYRNPMYTIGKVSPFKTKQLGPGPTYNVNQYTRNGQLTSPAYTMASRYPARTMLRTPGPGAHAPERCPAGRLPRAPAYTMGARLGFNPKRLGPAPNAYMLRGGRPTPAYTMGLKAKDKSIFKSPGPAQYFQQDPHVYLNKSPAYTLGARCDGAGKMTKTPGPAAYMPNLYAFKKSPAAFSFGVKHADWAPPMIVAGDTMDCL